MTAENWITIKRILDEVLRLAPVERERFFSQTDLPDEIKREVESLLAGERESEKFMSVSASGLTGEFFHETSLAGQQIGIYKIVRELGFGGMGAVYLAERTDGKFEQKVAVKMLKREFNTAKLRRNFEREKEILAKLEHPLIARLLDTGTTADGIPFLVMEYVEGVSVDKFCASKNLSLKERLKLFNKICEAVSFAHRNLIIHRDLKLSNILISDKGEPKLLDFGISKLLDAEKTTEKTSVTAFGAMTPEYASPEQMRGESVTTATDVYSLGIILYKILTGSLPYNFAGKTNGDVFKVVTRTEPAKPSKIQSSNSASGIQHLTLLKGDLDNIILKALAKEPGRRYETVEQFSADIWRYIDGLPVTARPATFVYRASKFLKRNKIAAIAGILIFFSLITGIFAAMREKNLANEQAQLAFESRNLARQETEKAKTEQAKSEKITKFMSKIIGYANPAWFAEGAKLKGQARVIDAVEDLSDKIDTEFANEPDVAAELHHKFAEVFHFVLKSAPAEQREKYKQIRISHALRALELRKQFHGERHELVAKDLFFVYEIIPDKTDEERAAILFEAIQMMRETNPRNLNFPYMFEAYAAYLILPQNEQHHEAFRKAVQPPTDENRYQIAERYLREAFSVWQIYYPPDHDVILARNCWLAYALAKQEKWTDFDEPYRMCKQIEKKRGTAETLTGLLSDVELVEKVLAEKNIEK